MTEVNVGFEPWKMSRFKGAAMSGLGTREEAESCVSEGGAKHDRNTAQKGRFRNTETARNTSETAPKQPKRFGCHYERNTETAQL